MKLAIVRKTYNPFGGAERYLDLLSRALAERGHEVHVFANRWPREASSPVAFHRIPMVGGLSVLKVWSFAVAAWARLRRFDGQVFSNERLFAQDVFRAPDGVHRTWLRTRRRHVSRLKRVSMLINPLHWSVRFFDWYIFNRRAFRAVIVASEFVKHDILRTYPRVRAEDVTVVYNGVDLARFRVRTPEECEASRRELGLAASQWVLLFIGTGFERKGLRYAIGALAHLPPEVILLVVGRGSTRRYQALARALGIADRVRFDGPQSQVERYYAAADLLVLPALYEPMGNVILEALASGVPVVTSRASGGAEIVSEGEDGSVIEDPADARAVAAHLTKVMSWARDPATARRARLKAERFGLDRALAETLAVLSRVHAGTSDGSRDADRMTRAHG
ncbi:MAG: glycosyltransferase family 4 protein [Nitrospiria bacterium]